MATDWFFLHWHSLSVFKALTFIGFRCSPIWAHALHTHRSLITERLEIFALIKKHVATALSLIIIVVSLASPGHATTQTETEIEKVRAKVQVLSTSKDSQVEIKFHDKTKVKGYITAVEPVSFTLRDPKDGKSQTIGYAEVDSVSKVSGGVSTKTWLIIGGVAAGAVTTFLIVKPAICDGGAQTRGIC